MSMTDRLHLLTTREGDLDAPVTTSPENPSMVARRRLDRRRSTHAARQMAGGVAHGSAQRHPHNVARNRRTHEHPHHRHHLDRLLRCGGWLLVGRPPSLHTQRVDILLWKRGAAVANSTMSNASQGQKLLGFGHMLAALADVVTAAIHLKLLRDPR